MIGLRGVWTAAERRAWRARLRRLPGPVAILSDIELAHRVAFGDGPGIVLNAGTGSIAFGRDARGRSARSGGWGALIGDDGSAFALGRLYLRERMAAGDSIERWRRYLVGPDAVRRISSLSRRVLRRAETGDRNAARLVRDAARDLGKLVADVRRRLNARGLPVHLTGGLFAHRRFRAEVEKEVGR